jgi:AraC-like DNA-binding protein
MRLNYQIEQFERFVSLLESHSPNEGFNLTDIKSLATFKSSTTQERIPVIEIPGIVIVGQGKKICHVGDLTNTYSPGHVLVGFYPIPVKMEIVEASPGAPYLLAGLQMDMGRMADVLLRLDKADNNVTKMKSPDRSSMYSLPLNDRLLDPFIRLLEALDNPIDAAMLGDSIIDEIYFRLLSDERGSELRFLLQQRGDIQRISTVVDHIHKNLDKPVSVQELAGMVHLSRTAFYEKFKEVMHMSPLQYAKSVKLHEAQKLIKEGKRANEACYMIGYSSPTQFSSEYKRHFGYSPSAT